MKNLNTFKLLSDYESEKSGGVLNTPNVSFVTEDNSVRYLLENDSHKVYEYVNLGLPSGLKWATCNVGASKPEDTGLYFAWGETTGYTAEQVTSGVRVFDEDTYNAGPAASISTDLTLEQDAAHTCMDGKWRMPTKAEFDELIDNCDHEWTDDYNGTGVTGELFISRVNENSVFFPATGSCYDSFVDGIGSDINYWSASNTTNEGEAYGLFFYKGYIDVVSVGSNRYWGFSVRGVCE